MPRLAPTLLVCCLALGLVAAAPAGAEHGSPSNFTAIPYDHGPGVTDATYEQHAVSPITYDYLDYIAATWDEGSFADCGATNSETFGIDRDNDDPGTQTDEGLSQYVEESKVDEDQFVADFYEKDDAIGSSTNLDEGDEFVSVTADCFTNPSEPGWYQISSSIGGTAANGSYVEASDISHYFYICECSSEEEARQQLGPPPSEPQQTATGTATSSPTATAEPTPTRTPPEEGTPLPSPTPTATPDQSTATSAPDTAGDADSTTQSSGGDGPASNGDDGADAEASGTSTTTSGDWDSYVRDTPTVADGPGFGSVTALLALVAAALVALRRR